MNEKPKEEEEPFAVVFDSLRAFQATDTGAAIVRVMTLTGDEEPAREALDELRRLSESMQEPELRTYTVS